MQTGRRPEEAVVDEAAERLRKLIAEQQIPAGRLLGLGVATAGIVDRGHRHHQPVSPPALVGEPSPERRRNNDEGSVIVQAGKNDMTRRMTLMPELDIQPRQSGDSVWAWFVAILIPVLLVWWIIAVATPRRTQTPPTLPVGGTRLEAPTGTATATTAGEPTVLHAGGAPMATPSHEPLPIVAIKRDPAQYHGKRVSGNATVTGVASDRGFCVEQNGERIFVIDGKTTTAAGKLQAGERVWLEGYVYETAASGRMPQVEPMDKATAKMLADQKVFMHVTRLQTVGSSTSAQS
jgi:hypothetical protein